MTALNFSGHVMSSHHSDQMSQRSLVSRMALLCQKVKCLVVTKGGIQKTKTGKIASKKYKGGGAP